VLWLLDVGVKTSAIVFFYYLLSAVLGAAGWDGL
jgi:hypothetical protein